jgi:signal transduction histidine kinase
MDTTTKILLVEDSDLDAELIRARLRAEGLVGDDDGGPTRVQTRDDFVAALRGGGRFDVILCDYSLPSFDGPSALALAREIAPETPFVLVSGMLGEEIAVDMLKRGATDYVLKQRLERLGTAVRQAIVQRRERAAREQAQEELRAAKEAAEAANRAKDRFLAVLSHELRTPLAPILATVQALELEQDALPQHVREAVDVIKRNAELEARLIDDLLDLTRVTRGKLQVHKRPVDAHRVVERAAEICRSELEGSSDPFRLDLRATRTQLQADPARLQQVLWNLMKNAVKFTPGDARGAGGDGRVDVRTRDGTGAEGTAGCFVLEVQDRGIGIPADALPRIFQAFEQGGEDVSRIFGGLGLGLAIARSLAELHGGRLEAFSDGPGRGATFRLTLPGATEPATVPATFSGRAAAAAAARSGGSTAVAAAVAPASPSAGAADAPAAAGADGPPPRRLRILLVEDHEDTARAMSWLLKRGGHDVKVAHNVADAVAMGAAAHFDLLISDIGLPDGTGLDVIRQMPRRDIPAIALTGFGMEHDVARSLEAGFTEHLTKPVNFQKLEAVISTLSKG